MKVLMVLASFGMLAMAQYPGSRSVSYGAPSAAASPSYSAPTLGLSVAEFSSSSVRAAPQRSYGAPQQNYGAPAAAPSRSSGGYQQQQSGGYQQQQQSGGYQQQQSGGYQQPQQQQQSGGYQQQQQSYQAPSNNGGYQGGNNNNGGRSNNGGYDNNDSGAQEQKVHKHVYIHVAPSETPEPKAISAPRAPQIPEKHYKILFIRTPEPAPYTQPDIIDGPPAAEQKTLVYVLLKKPDATPAIQLPTAAPTKPSKPEVYFIRYKSPESANAAGGPRGGEYGAPVADPSSQYGSPQ